MKFEKVEKLVEIASLKPWVSTKKGVHRRIKINQKARLKPYIDMNTELRKKAKNDFERDIFKLMTI